MSTPDNLTKTPAQLIYGTARAADIAAHTDSATAANSESTVTIPTSQYLKLVGAAKKLAVLEGFGVDNWEGYDEAMAVLYRDDEEEA